MEKTKMSLAVKSVFGAAALSLAVFGAAEIRAQQGLQMQPPAASAGQKPAEKDAQKAPASTAPATPSASSSSSSFSVPAIPPVAPALPKAAAAAPAPAPVLNLGQAPGAPTAPAAAPKAPEAPKAAPAAPVVSAAPAAPVMANPASAAQKAAEAPKAPAAAPAAQKATVAPAGKGAISDNVIRIGILSDMQNIYAKVAGRGAVVAARMAVEDFGKKEINGAKIEIVAADDNLSSEIAKNVTERWVNKEKVDMITGMTAANVSVAAAREASKKKVPVFAHASGGSIINADCNPYFVQWTQATYNYAVGQGKPLVEAGKKTWFVITADYAYGRALESDIKTMLKKYNGTYLGEARHSFPGFDFTEQLKKAKESGAQVIALANGGSDTTGVLLQAKKLGIGADGKQTIVPMRLYMADIEDLTLAEAGGKTGVLAYYWNATPEGREFAKRYYEKTRRMPDLGQAGTYSAVLAYLKAVEAAGSDDGDAVLRELKKIKINDGIFANGYIREDLLMVHDVYQFRIKKKEESKNPWDMFEPLKTIPGDEAAPALEDSKCPYLVKKWEAEGKVKQQAKAEPAKAAAPAAAPVVPAAPAVPAKADAPKAPAAVAPAAPAKAASSIPAIPPVAPAVPVAPVKADAPKAAPAAPAAPVPAAKAPEKDAKGVRPAK